MKTRRFLILCVAFLILFSSSVYGYSAKSYILMDRHTKKVLTGQNYHEEMLMASTTKIMTAIIALEIGSLDSEFVIPKEAVGIEGSSIYLEEGETFKLIDLLYGLMIRSGNDSAVAIAMAVAGSEEHFVYLMNKKAQMIGANNTSFENPHGLNAQNHFTTAYDLALITAYAMDNPLFREIANTKQYKSTTLEGRVRDFHSSNKFLLNYPYATASKTGYTTKAGRCLSAVGQKGDLEFVAVLLNAPDWFDDAMALIDWGFENFTPIELITKGKIIDVAGVTGGMEKYIPVITDETVYYPAKNNTDPVITYEKEIYPKKAPISAGEKLGEYRVFADSELIFVTDLVALGAVEAKPLPWYKKLLKSLSFIRGGRDNG